VLPMASCLPASSINFVQPGQFTVKQTPGAGVTTVTVIGPANGGAATAWANAACYGIHVDVQRPLVW